MSGNIEILNTETLGDIVLNQGQIIPFTNILEEGCGCGGQPKKKYYQVRLANKIIKVSFNNAKVI